MKLSKQQETVITWSAIAAGLLLASYVVYEVFFKKSDYEQNLADLEKQGIRPTISEAQALGYADKLQEELDEFFPDLNDIESVLAQLSNKADILLIIAKYGKRWNFGIYNGLYTLPQFMNVALNSNNLGEINTFLKNKNIDFKF